MKTGHNIKFLIFNSLIPMSEPTNVPRGVSILYIHGVSILYINWQDVKAVPYACAYFT